MSLHLEYLTPEGRLTVGALAVIVAAVALAEGIRWLNRRLDERTERRRSQAHPVRSGEKW